MGDRVNIEVRQSSGSVFFYGHWSGSDAILSVYNALALRERWDDESYLARIIFDSFRGDDVGTSGFGISTCIQDNEYPLIVVDCNDRKVKIENCDGAYCQKEAIGKSFSFIDFVDKTICSWDSIIYSS